MRYEYRVHTVGMSAWNSLEDIGDSLQTALNSEPIAELVGAGWEVWQVNTLYSHQTLDNKGLIIVLRRPIP